MPEGKQPRKPEGVVARIAGHTTYVGCGCGPTDRQHDPKNTQWCARAHFSSLLREQRVSLRSRP